MVRKLFKMLFSIVAASVMALSITPNAYAWSIELAASANADNNRYDHVLRIIYADGSSVDRTLTVDEMKDMVQFGISGEFTHRNIVSLQALANAIGAPADQYTYYGDWDVPVGTITVFEDSGLCNTVVAYGGTEDIDWTVYDPDTEDGDITDEGTVTTDVPTRVHADDSDSPIRQLVYALNHGEENESDVCYLKDGSRTGVQITLHFVGNPDKPVNHGSGSMTSGSGAGIYLGSTGGSDSGGTNNPIRDRIIAGAGKIRK